jgi:predicted phage terminase large subunit-like protein
MINDLNALDATLRLDLSSFIAKVFETLCPGERFLENWHIDSLAWRLAPAASGQRMRLIINLPPRSLKSIAASVALPAWLLGHNPSCRIITVSYADDLARKHARDTRIIMESAWYQRVFPATRVNRRRNTETELTTTWEFPDLLRTAIAHAANHRVNTILIEDANSGSALSQSLRQQSRLNVVDVKALVDKRTRAAQQSAAFEAGRVLLPQEALWLAEFEKELLAFPNGRFDDQVDSAVQFLQWAAQLAQYDVPIVVPYVVFGEPRKNWDAPLYW